ncbi:hypothetical protein DPMN_142184 [Dreissena polymorpha]|uniref:Uncharacterized protein n=1 Tax=Dreissena polymorpha TaxID=45954 RepID=A0A9D4GE34_DREPO|nr:hypothetical protein DPMN_142184 [Dreissena polymorpha]
MNKKEWSEVNILAIVFGSVGDALLIETCIATIMIITELSSIRTSTKDLHYGLVYSHFTDFSKIYEQPASEQLTDGHRLEGKLIERFLLVIPNTFELILTIPENPKSSATCTWKQITLEHQKEVNVNKLKLYKLKMGEEEYYVFAEVPTVLNVIYSLSQTPRGKTVAGVVRQKFQLLYKRVLSSYGCENNVQFVTCKGKDDIAMALFEAARALSKKGNAIQQDWTSTATIRVTFGSTLPSTENIVDIAI